MEHIETDKLIKQAQEGDKSAFGALVRSHYSLIYRTAYKWCGRQEDAEDITQNVCLKLADVIHQYRGDAKFSTWLYRVTLNVAKDYQKSHSRKAGKENTELELDLFACSQPDQERSMIARQLYLCIAQLPEKLRLSVVLVCAEGLTHAEASVALECREGTISWRLNQAREKLALCLEKGVVT